MSAEDIGAGSRWSRDIEQQLQHTNYGIICLTRSNASAPWVNFEAGAIAKSVENSLVCPYLLDLESSQIPRGPLNLFQAKTANQAETWELLQSINGAMENGSLNEQQLRRTFDRWWPDLEDILTNLPEEDEDAVEVASEEQVMAEVLDTVRTISRRLQRDDMERVLLRAAKAFSEKNVFKSNLFSSNLDMEDIWREKLRNMSFKELEEYYEQVQRKASKPEQGHEPIDGDN